MGSFPDVTQPIKAESGLEHKSPKPFPFPSAQDIQCIRTSSVERILWTGEAISNDLICVCVIK